MKLRNLLLMLCSVLLSSCGVGNIEESSQEVTKESVSITFIQLECAGIRYVEEHKYVDAYFYDTILAETTLEFPYNYYLSKEELEDIKDHRINYVVPELPSWGGYYSISNFYLDKELTGAGEILRGGRYLAEDLTVYFGVY